ncbi:MAG: MFS transporter [Spirochaetaceae bacterium]|nr:MFS transporter [Spirochaetaceae bacterium]
MKKRFSLLLLIKTYSGLSSPIYVLFIARVINRMGDFIHLFMTLYLTRIIGFDVKMVGFFVMITAASSILGSVTGGKLSDYVGRKYVMVGAQFTSAAILVVCGFLPSTMIIPVMLIIASFFTGAVRPASRSMLTDLTKSSDRQKAFSLLYLGTNFGVAIGPMIAGFLFLNHLPWIFWGDSITTFIAFSLVLKYVPESNPTKLDIKERTGNSLEKAVEGSALKAFLSRPVLVLFSIFTVMANFIYAQMTFSLPLHLNEIFEDKGSEIFGYLMSFNAVIVLLFTAFVLSCSKRIKAVYNMAFAALLFAVGFGALSVINSFPGFVITTFIWTIGEILMVTNGSVYIANHTPINLRGRFNAITGVVFGLGYLVGPFISGLILARGTISDLWVFILFFSLLTGGLFFGLGKYESITK